MFGGKLGFGVGMTRGDVGPQRAVADRRPRQRERPELPGTYKGVTNMAQVGDGPAGRAAALAGAEAAGRGALRGWLARGVPASACG